MLDADPDDVPGVAAGSPAAAGQGDDAYGGLAAPAAPSFSAELAGAPTGLPTFRPAWSTNLDGSADRYAGIAVPASTPSAPPAVTVSPGATDTPPAAQPPSLGAPPAPTAHQPPAALPSTAAPASPRPMPAAKPLRVTPSAGAAAAPAAGPGVFTIRWRDGAWRSDNGTSYTPVVPSTDPQNRGPTRFTDPQGRLFQVPDPVVAADAGPLPAETPSVPVDLPRPTADATPAPGAGPDQGVEPQFRRGIGDAAVGDFDLLAHAAVPQADMLAQAAESTDRIGALIDAAMTPDGQKVRLPPVDWHSFLPQVLRPHPFTNTLLQGPVGDWLAARPRNGEERLARTVGQFAPGLVAGPEADAGVAKNLLVRGANVLVPALSSHLAGETARAAGAPHVVEQAARLIGGLAGGLGVGAAVGARAGRLGQEIRSQGDGIPQRPVTSAVAPPSPAVTPTLPQQTTAVSAEAAVAGRMPQRRMSATVTDQREAANAGGNDPERLAALPANPAQQARAQPEQAPAQPLVTSPSPDVVQATAASSAPKVAPLAAGEITTYKDATLRRAPGQDLEGHELWQHANLRAQGLANRRLSTPASRNNPVVMLPKSIHARVNSAQRALNAAAQTPIENIGANAQILRSLGVASEKDIARLHDMAIKHAKSHGH